MSFSKLKEGDVIYYTYKGQKNKTTIIAVKSNDTMLKFKTVGGDTAGMSLEAAEGTTFKDAKNYLWEI